MNIDQLFDNTRALPVIPRVLQELLNSFNSSNGKELHTSALVKLISSDTALCARLLALVNSARYRPSQAVGSVHQAVQLLGLVNVRSLVISMGLMSCFANFPANLRTPFWQHSLRTAALARHWAGLAQVDGELAYILSLLHGVGQLVMRQSLAQQMQALDAQMAPFAPPRLAAEHAALGFNYADVGAQLVRRWQFPVLFPQVIGAADARVDNPQARTLADLIALASWQAWVSQEPLSAEQIDILWPTELAQRVGVSAQLGGSHFAAWAELCGDLSELLSEP